jgi:hypothetical protein
VTTDRIVTLIRLFADEFDRRGWRDPGDVAQALARSVAAGQSATAAVEGVQSRFLVQNGISTRDLIALFTKVQADYQSLPSSHSEATPAEGAAGSDLKGDTSRRKGSHRRAVLVSRLLIAVLIVAATTWAVIVLPDSLGWTWLLNHPNGLALRALAVAVAMGLALSLAAARKEILVVVLVPAVLGLLALLGK